MEYKEFKMDLRPQGLYIEAGYLQFSIGYYQQKTMMYDESARWCRDTGGLLPTLEQALVICEHILDINKALRGAGQPVIGEYLWTRRKHPLVDGAVYAVNMSTGTIDKARKASYNTARSIIPARK